MMRVKLFASKVFIEANKIVIYQAQHGMERGADFHSNVEIVGLWAVILIRVNNALGVDRKRK